VGPLDFISASAVIPHFPIKGLNMSNGHRDLNKSNETERTISVALIGLAGAVFAGLLALWPGMLASLNHTGVLFSSVVGIAILTFLAVSMIFGGRGCAYGPKYTGWRNRFNFQAVFGGIAILLILVLAGIIFATAEPSPNEKFAAKQTAFETRLTDVKTNADTISREIIDLKNRLDAVEKSIAVLDRTSSNYSNKLSEIDGSLKSLSERVEKVENNTTQVKP
jgi:hypothetical protein